MSWRNRPTFKEKWDKGDMIVFIDESGTASLKNIQSDIKQGKVTEKNNRYFTVLGCVIRREDYPHIKNEIIKLKNKHWENGMYQYPKGKKRVCFHSTEIRRAKGAFGERDIDRDVFLTDLTKFMGELPVKIIAVTIDKYELCLNYHNPYNPYNIAMEFILERIVNYQLGNDEEAIIVLEARGSKEDKSLLKQIINIIDNGNYYVSAPYFKKIRGVYFNEKWCRQSSYKKSYFGLELADLLAYPIHKFTTTGEKDRAFISIENKICGYNTFRGYYGRGIKIFPKKNSTNSSSKDLVLA